MNVKLWGFGVLFLFLCTTFVTGVLMGVTLMVKPSREGNLSVTPSTQPTYVFYDNQTSVFIESEYELTMVTDSGSMYPIIQDDSFTLMRENFVVGELLNKIIIYDYGNHSIIHRCIELREDACLMKGDNNGGVDGWVKFKDMVGVVDWILTPV